MTYRDIILTANANLRKSKLRTFLTVTAVVVGAFTLTKTNGVGDGIKNYVNVQLGNVGARDSLFVTARGPDQAVKDANNGLTEYSPDRQKITQMVDGPPGGSYLIDKDIAKIAAIPGVKDVTRIYTINTEYITAGGKKFQTLIGQHFEGFNIDLDAGRLASNNSTDEVTIPQKYLKPLGLPTNPKDALGKTVTFGFLDPAGQLFTKDGKIVGVQRASLIGSSGVDASTPWVKAIYDQQTTATGLPPVYPYLAARFDLKTSASEQSALKQRFTDQGYEAKTIQDELGTVNQILSAVTMGLNVFGAIALLAASFGIINTLFMSVQERTSEIGLMKALGMGRRKIFLLFSLEAILIGFWGSLIGIGLANLAGRALNSVATKTFLKDFDGFKLLAFPLDSMLLVLAIIMVISFLAGSLPARRASRKDPIEALRYE